MAVPYTRRTFDDLYFGRFDDKPQRLCDGVTYWDATNKITHISRQTKIPLREIDTLVKIAIAADIGHYRVDVDFVEDYNPASLNIILRIRVGAQMFSKLIDGFSEKLTRYPNSRSRF